MSTLRRVLSARYPQLSRIRTMTTSIDRANFYADAKAPIVNLTAKTHFEQLTLKEQKYAHYFSKAAHAGTRVVLRSVSPESEWIYDLILTIHRKLRGDYGDLEAATSAEVVQKYLEYASMFLSNAGNYKSFGDVKFVPAISEAEFDAVVAAADDQQAAVLYRQARTAIFSLDAKNALLGWNDAGHVSAYYLNVVSRAEAEAVNAALAQQGILPENTRVSKAAEAQFVVHVASADKVDNTGYYPKLITFQLQGAPASLTFRFGDHATEFSKICDYLAEAQKYARDERQHRMLEQYVAAFRTGSMQAHWDSQVEWVQDVGPAVETNIGFIETYRDPSGVRGEWEGLVSMVNKERTAKFQTLVENAPRFIAQLPWDAAFEKDEFQAPDFTSLEVLTFASSGVPAGINLPNYRLDVGFKNVSLGNVLSSKTSNDPVTFVEDAVQDVFAQYRADAFEVQVGAHELLGHGTGKLLAELDDGKFNFDIAAPPAGVDGKPVSTYYRKGETWSAAFGGLSGTMEECRAELVGLYLHLSRDFLEIFGYTEKAEQDKVVLVSWLNMARAGLVGLEQWDPQTQKWGQPHMQARFTIFKTMLECGLVSLHHTAPDYSDLVLRLDESKIADVGKRAVGDYLRQLHVYKCSADVENGIAFYTEKSSVSAELARYRDVVMAKRLPRKQFVQANTSDMGDRVVVTEYAENELGMIQSFVERDT